MEDRSPRKIIGMIIVLIALTLGVIGIFLAEDRQAFWTISAALFLISGLFAERD